MKNHLKILFLVPATLLALYSCGHLGKGTDKDDDDKGTVKTSKDSAGLHKDEVMLSLKQCEAMGIQYGSLQKKNLNNAVHANGYLVTPPQDKADVSVFIGGVVKSIAVNEGDKVKKGQNLAVLEHPDYVQLQQDYLSARNNFILAEKEYWRQKTLYSSNTTAEKKFQKAESDYNSLKIEMASLSEKLRILGIDTARLDYRSITPDIAIKSPIDGYVNAIHAAIGKYIDTNATMFEVVNISRMNLVLQVFENNISKIHPGQYLTFTLPNDAGGQGEGIVYAIDKTFDNVKKSFSVRAKVNSASSQIVLPGVYVNAIIETTNSPVNTLPDEAIVRDGQTEYVFIFSRTKTIAGQKSNIFEMKEVKTGMTGGGVTSVTLLEEVPENAKFVTKGAYYIQSEKNKGDTEDLD